jgi:hypothetical protein
MGYPYPDDVNRAYNELVAEGKIGPRTDQAQVEADKGLCTQRAAYYSSLRSPTYGVMLKPSGNNYLAADGQRYSVDWIYRTDGTGWDVMTDAGGLAQPSNGGPTPSPENLANWRAASLQNAQLSEAPPNPEPEPEPPADNSEVLAAIAASEARVIEAVAKDGQQTRDLIVHYADQVDQWATIILAAWLKINAPTDPTRKLIEKVKKAIAAIRDQDDRP